jgi:hypothetical protein
LATFPAISGTVVERCKAQSFVVDGRLSITVMSFPKLGDRLAEMTEAGKANRVVLRV